MLPRAGQVCHLISSCVHLFVNVTQTHFSICNTVNLQETVMATSTEMSLLRSSAALVNPSQRKRLMSCLKMETRTTRACWTLMDDVYKLHFLLFMSVHELRPSIEATPMSIFPQNSSRWWRTCSKTETQGHSLPLTPATGTFTSQCHSNSLPPFVLFLPPSHLFSRQTDKHLCGVCQVGLPLKPSCKDPRSQAVVWFTGSSCYDGTQIH